MSSRGKNTSARGEAKRERNHIIITFELSEDIQENESKALTYTECGIRPK